MSQDVAIVGQDLDLVTTIKKPDGTLETLTGHTADMELIKPDGSTDTKAGVVDTGASTVTASLLPADLLDAQRGIWTYYPVIKSGGKEWPGLPNHFHLVARG